jgi:hypothetical protein
MNLSNGVKLSEIESELIEMVRNQDLWVKDSLTIERLSSQPFALRISGKKSYTKPSETTYDFSCSLILASIASLLRWSSPAIASLTDHPDLARQGDWSGVRDSDDDKIYYIFQQHVIPLLSKPRVYTQENFNHLVQSTTNMLNKKKPNTFIVVNWEIQLADKAALKLIVLNKTTQEKHEHILSL